MISYQGGKQRLARQIIDYISPPKGAAFSDLCCGSGAVSMEAVRQGHDPCSVCMVDSGPWGDVWGLIGDGRFDTNRFAQLCRDIPADPEKIQMHIKWLSRQPVGDDAPYVFLVLQAASFGGKAIWDKAGAWQNCSFRSYWKPTVTSSRRSPVNPMMPMPRTLLPRVEETCALMLGVKGLRRSVENFTPPRGTVYIDPPYAGTAGYGAAFDVVRYVSTLAAPAYVSEGRPLGPQAVLLSSGRAKGGMSGNRKAANEEWLTYLDPCELLAR